MVHRVLNDIQDAINTGLPLDLTGLAAATVKLKDNTASALAIKEGSTNYIRVDTTNGSEMITLDKLVAFTTGISGSVSATGGVGIGTILTAGVGASTAAAGNAAGNAGALPAGTAFIYPTTAADDTAGVIISASDKVTGRVFYVGNGVSNKILKIYPPSGGAINGAAGDAAYSTASGKGALVVCLSSSGNTWFALG